VSLTFAAPEVSKRRRESLAAGGGPHQGAHTMEDADDIELAGWLFKGVLAILAAPVFAVMASFILS
jgi:hypothetical protein